MKQSQENCASLGEKGAMWEYKVGTPSLFSPIGDNKSDPTFSDQQQCENCKPDQYIKQEFEKHFVGGGWGANCASFSYDCADIKSGNSTEQQPPQTQRHRSCQNRNQTKSLMGTWGEKSKIRRVCSIGL